LQGSARVTCPPLTVNAVVDTGATTLIINEETRARLGLLVEDAGEVTGDLRSLAGGVKSPCRVTETVKICWKNRRASCEAVVIPDEEDVLLGALPLETMDLTINPRQQEVIGAHGDKVRYVVK
jgi:predicted aspartyl protease